jgi:hypothetical protein
VTGAITIRDLRGCARCGGNHGDVRAKKLSRPMSPPECSVSWSHWFMCPKLLEPVLVAIVEDGP